MTHRPLTPDELDAVRRVPLPCRFCETGQPVARLETRSAVSGWPVSALVCRACLKDRLAVKPEKRRKR